MKLKILLILIVGFIFSLKAQEVVISGIQSKGNNDNLLIQSNEVILTKKYKIIKVETNANGFWIERDGKILQSFLKKNNKFSPQPLGIILEPGKYKAFPNLDEKQKSSYIKLYLKPE